MSRFCSIHCVFLMKTVRICYGKFHFLLVVGDIVEKNLFAYSGLGQFGRQYYLWQPRIEPELIFTFCCAVGHYRIKPFLG